MTKTAQKVVSLDPQKIGVGLTPFLRDLRPEISGWSHSRNETTYTASKPDHKGFRDSEGNEVSLGLTRSHWHHRNWYQSQVSHPFRGETVRPTAPRQTKRTNELIAKPTQKKDNQK